MGGVGESLVKLFLRFRFDSCSAEIGERSGNVGVRLGLFLEKTVDHLVLVGVALLLLLLLRGRADLAGDESPLMEEHLRRVGAVVRGAAGVADHWRGIAPLLLAVNNRRHVAHASHLRVDRRGLRTRNSSVAQFSFSFWNPNHASVFERCDLRIAVRSLRFVAFSVNHFSHHRSWRELVKFGNFWMWRTAAAETRLLTQLFFERLFLTVEVQVLVVLTAVLTVTVIVAGEVELVQVLVDHGSSSGTEEPVLLGAELLHEVR